MECMNCGKEIESKGTKPAKYCSDACRKRYKRTQKRTELETDVANGQDDLSDGYNEWQRGNEEAESLNYCIIDGIKRPLNYGEPDCACQHCKGVAMNGLKLTLNHGPYKNCAELAEHERNRIALPGDIDYEGVGVRVA